MKPSTEGYVIGQLIARMNTTCTQLAKVAGVAPTTLYRLTSGEIQSVRASTLLLIANALGVTPEDLRHEDILNRELPTMADTVTEVAKPRAPVPTGVPLYKISKIDTALRGDTGEADDRVPPPPFEEYKGFTLIALTVPAGYSESLGLENGDVVYIRPWGEEKAVPIAGDVVIAEVNGRPLPMLLRWKDQMPEGVHPRGSVIAFARSWV